MEKQNKKSLKWLWITIAIVLVAGVAVWCAINAVNFNGGLKGPFNFSSTFVMFVLLFIIMALGYLLGGVEIKGVSLGTAGVFLVAILFGWLCTLPFENVPLLGAFHVNDVTDALVKNLAKNFKTYIVIGAIVILSGALVAVICTLLTPEYGPEFWSGILSGALTSTPGFSAAQDAATENLPLITLGHAIAYPFGVIGVVLFVQLMPKFLKSDMAYERELLKIGGDEEKSYGDNLFAPDPLGLTAFGLAVVAGLLLGSIKIPLTGDGYNGSCFSLGTTGGVLIMCLVFGHFGHFGKLSLQIPAETTKILREFGLMLFLLGAGFEGGVSLVGEISKYGGAIVAWGFIGGALMTTVPMVVGFFIAKYVMKLPLLNNLGSITGGMTSTPALGTLCKTAGTDDVASAYASTYPIALVLIVLACQLMITLM